MISKDQIQAAFTAATEALTQNKDLSWIRNSWVVERAYFLGLMSGLAPIVADGDLDAHVAQTLLKTMWARKADDTFPSTQIGQKFDLLRKHLRDYLDHLANHIRNPVSGDSSPSDSLISESMRDLRDTLGQETVNFQKALKRIDEILSEFPLRDSNQTLTEESLRSRTQFVGTIEPRLEELLRFVALLETDHELSKRLGMLTPALN